MGSLHSDLSLLTSREEPDGQSERLEVTPPTGLLSVPGESTCTAQPLKRENVGTSHFVCCRAGFFSL